jgi:hypothetical protein
MEDVVIPFATFDSDALNVLQAAVDHALRNLPPDQQTPQTKDRMAKAVMRVAAQGERDPIRLNGIAVTAITAKPVDVYDIEVRQGNETLSSLRSIELPDPTAVWGHIAELTKKVSAPKSRIRVLVPIRRDTHFHGDRDRASSPFSLKAAIFARPARSARAP